MNLLKFTYISCIYSQIIKLYSLCIVHNSVHNQARRQEFPEEGGVVDSHRELLLRQGVRNQKQGIWCKILQSSNFQALHSNFWKVLIYKKKFQPLDPHPSGYGCDNNLYQEKKLCMLYVKLSFYQNTNLTNIHFTSWTLPSPR